jgi:LAO/AO transport system kinase
VNKSDRDGADQVVADIGAMLALSGAEAVGREVIFRTNALTGDGVTVLIDALVDRAARVEPSQERVSQRAREEILLLIEREIARRVRGGLAQDARLKSAVESVVTRQSDPYTAAESLLDLFGPLEVPSGE